jgi:hypothetical protein
MEGLVGREIAHVKLTRHGRPMDGTIVGTTATAAEVRWADGTESRITLRRALRHLRPDGGAPRHAPRRPASRATPVPYVGPRLGRWE